MDKRERLDQIGREWCAMPKEGDEAAKMALQNEVFLLAMELFPGEIDAMGAFFEGDWQKFDADKGALSAFFSARLGHRMKDLARQDIDGRRETKISDRTDKEIAVKTRHDSLDMPIGDDSGDTMGSLIPGKSSEGGNKLALDDMTLELLTLMLTLPERLSGRANNPARINYYRLFFTDSAVEILQTSSHGQVFIRHERDLFTAIKTEFLDYILYQSCRTAVEIINSDLKRYGDLVDGRTMDEPPGQPLPLDVYAAYIKRVEQKNVNTSAISMQRSSYRDFLKEYIQC